MSLFLQPVNIMVVSADEEAPDNEEVAQATNEEVSSEEEPELSQEKGDTEESGEDSDSDPNEKPAQTSVSQNDESEFTEGETEESTPPATPAQIQLNPGDDNGEGKNGDGENVPQPSPPAPEEPELIVHPIEPYANQISGTANLDAQVIVFYPGTEHKKSASVDDYGNWEIINTNNVGRHLTPGSVVPIDLHLEDDIIHSYEITVEGEQEQEVEDDIVILADEYEPVPTGASFNIEFTDDGIIYPDETAVVSNFWELPQGTRLEYTNILNLGQTGEITEETVNISVIYPDGSSDALDPTLATVIPAQIDTPEPESTGGNSVETEAGNSNDIVSNGDEEQGSGETVQEVPEISVSNEVNSYEPPAPELLPETGTSNHSQVLGLIVLLFGLGLIVFEKGYRKQH